MSMKTHISSKNGSESEFALGKHYPENDSIYTDTDDVSKYDGFAYEIIISKLLRMLRCCVVVQMTFYVSFIISPPYGRLIKIKVSQNILLGFLCFPKVPNWCVMSTCFTSAVDVDIQNWEEQKKQKNKKTSRNLCKHPT